MKMSPKYRIPFKRRLDQKTDYNKRLRLLSSEKPRLVVRKSLKHTKAQIIDYDPKGDKVIVSATSQELKKFGWKGSTSNIPSAYLVGLLVGKKSLEKKVKSVVLDTGLQTKVMGCRIFSVLKGALDAGLDVPHSPEALPSDEKIKGADIADYGQKLKKQDKKKFDAQFSITDPEKLPKMFGNVKSKIMKG